MRDPPWYPRVIQAALLAANLWGGFEVCTSNGAKFSGAVRGDAARGRWIFWYCSPLILLGILSLVPKAQGQHLIDFPTRPHDLVPKPRCFFRIGTAVFDDIGEFLRFP